jgi:hypothetical protein
VANSLQSTRQLAAQVPGTKAYASELRNQPTAVDIARFELEGHTFLNENFGESIPPMTVDKVYAGFPLPQGRASRTSAAPRTWRSTRS